MRWSLVLCLLLASAVLAKPRPKRSLGYIKSVILTKLFGPRDTTVIVTHPVPDKHIANPTYQLYKVPGFDDILIKVSKKLLNVSENNEADKEEKDKNKIELKKPVKPLRMGPVIVKPEVAIVGSYLGTSTEKETMIALDVVKQLLKSGILNGGSDNLIQEVAMPMISEPHFEYIEQNIPKEYLNVYTGNGMKQVDVINRNVIPVYPVEYSPPLEASEIELGPVQSKYSYKQKDNTADMTYESYNSKDVIVTRTKKEPPLPQFIKLRLAEVATIGANPYIVQKPLRISGPAPMTVPYVYFNPGLGSYNSIRINEALQESTDGKTSYVPNVQNFILCAQKFTEKRCPYENIYVKTDSSKQPNPTLSNDKAHDMINETVDNYNTNANQAFNEFLKNQSVNGQLVSKYSYNQMNHQSHDNYTIVDLGVRLQSSNYSKVDVAKDFVFIPPIVDVPSPTALGFKENIERNSNDVIKSNDNAKYNLKQNPIFVPDEPENTDKLSDTKTNRADAKEISDVNNKRGDIPGSTF